MSLSFIQSSTDCSFVLVLFNIVWFNPIRGRGTLLLLKMVTYIVLGSGNPLMMITRHLAYRNFLGFDDSQQVAGLRGWVRARERESFTWKCQVTWEPVLRVVCSVCREVFLIVDVWEMINIYTDFLHIKIQNIYIIYNIYIYIYIIYVHIPNSRSTRYHRILARRVVIGFKKRCLAGLRPYTDGTKTTNLRYFRSRHLTRKISIW